MTSPNNLKGHINNIDFKEIYKEKLENGLYVIVFYKHETKYCGKNEYWQNSSIGEVVSVITDNTLYKWSNNVLSYEGETEWIDANFPLKELKTKRGWRVYQWVDKAVSNKENNKIHIKWIVEIPIDEMLNLLKVIKY